MTETLVLPSSDDPVVAGAVGVIGGPPGRHARIGESRFWTPVRVLIVLTLLTCGFGYAQKLPCRDGSNWVNEYQYTRACYSDVIALYGSEGLADGQTPYYQHPVEYPVVIGAVMKFSAIVARDAEVLLPFDDRQTKARHDLAKATTDQARADARGQVSYADKLARTRFFYDVTWLLMTLGAVVVVIALARTAGRRPWDAALFALAPAIVIHEVTNWDFVAIALATVGMLAWARKRPLVAGVLLGLAAATKLYPALFLVPLFVLCLRAGKLRTWTALAVATVVTAVGVTLPVYLTAPSYADKGDQAKVLTSPLDRLGSEGLSALLPLHCITSDGTGTHLSNGRCRTGSQGTTAVNAVYRFFDLNQTRGADWDSLHYLAKKKIATDKGFLKGLRNGFVDLFSDNDSGPVPSKLNRFVAVSQILVMLALAALILLAPRRPRVPQVLFLALVGFLLANKVDSPQYTLWLLPLAALANPRWKPFLVWQATEVMVIGTRFYFFIGNDKPGQGLGENWFFTAIVLRDLMLLVFSAYIVRDILRPEHDPVRADGSDDPAGGVLDGAPDAAPDAAQDLVLEPA